MIEAIIAGLVAGPQLISAYQAVFARSKAEGIPVSDAMLEEELKRRNLWEDKWKQLAPAGYVPPAADQG